MRLELFKQPDGSWKSAPAATAGVAEVIVQGISGKVYACGFRAVVAGDTILWDGHRFRPGLSIFKEGHDPEEEFLNDLS